MDLPEVVCAHNKIGCMCLQPLLGKPNFSLELHAHVTRVIIEAGRAVGVEYTQHGERRQARGNPVLRDFALDCRAASRLAMTTNFNGFPFPKI